MKSEELLNTANCFLTFSRKQSIDTFCRNLYFVDQVWRILLCETSPRTRPAEKRSLRSVCLSSSLMCSCSILDSYICSTLIKTKFMVFAYTVKCILIVHSIQWIWWRLCPLILWFNDLFSGQYSGEKIKTLRFTSPTVLGSWCRLWPTISDAEGLVTLINSWSQSALGSWDKKQNRSAKRY